MLSNEKRVKLAKDVINLLNVGDIRAVRNYYMMLLGPEVTGTGKAICETCVLGALVVACCGTQEYRRGGDPEPIMECLKDQFEPEQVVLIEAAYESDDEPPILRQYISKGVRPDVGDESLKAAAEMYSIDADGYWDDRYMKKPDETLRAIMQNIIDHDGKFVV